MSNLALRGELVQVNQLTEWQTHRMFHLMEQFYDDTNPQIFVKDLSEKHYCVLLFDEHHELQGFSTQMLLSVNVGGKMVQGIFSGDTIIHRDHWGSFELFRVFAQYLIPLGAEHIEFYWFLTSKGYKTYKMLPAFFNQFYPDYRNSTPDYEQAIIHAFGRQRYPAQYDERRGVIVYGQTRDRLKPGVADVTRSRLKDRHVLHFLEKNPHYQSGDDLVCVASLKEDNFRPSARKLLIRQDASD